MNWNGIIPYLAATPQELQEAAGITQFVGANGWYQTINGLLVQGGKINIISGSSATAFFPAPFTSQLLFVTAQVLFGSSNAGYSSIDPANTDLTKVTIYNTGNSKDYYWLAVGV